MIALLASGADQQCWLAQRLAANNCGTGSPLVSRRLIASRYHEHGFGQGVHLRRIHYRLISQVAPIRMPLGGAYVNTVECSDTSSSRSKSWRCANDRST